jgi:hypothetical protein
MKNSFVKELTVQEIHGQFKAAFNDETFCREHGCYFVECKDLGHGEDYNPNETLGPK